MKRSRNFCPTESGILCTDLAHFPAFFDGFIEQILNNFNSPFGPFHSGSFCKNFAHFSGNFWEFKKLKKVKKWF